MTGTDGGMPEKGKLSRREFLRLSKAVLGLLIFAACGPEPTQIPSVTGTSAPPPETPVLPPEAPVSQSTPIPTKPLSPIFPPIDEPIPQPTPIVEGPTVPGETLNIGGADLELKTTSGKELAAQIGAEEKGWKIVADENENSSFFTGYAGEEGKEVQVVFLAQAPEGYLWDSENMVWKHDDQVFIPDILLPGGWDTDKQMAGPAHEADEVFLFKDNSNYRIGIIYSKEKMPEIPDKSKLEILPDGSGLYVSDPKTITLDNGQQITRDLNENLRLVNPDGSYLLKRTSWGNVKSEEQIYQAVAFAGLVEAIPEAPYPGEKLTQEAIVPFANAFGVSPEEVGNLIPKLLTGADGKQFVVMTTGDLAATAGFDESGTPLLIYTNEGQWRSISEKDLSPSNMTIGAAINKWTGDFNDPQYQSTFLKNYNLGATDGVFDQGTLFRNIKVQEGEHLTPQQVVDQYYWKVYEDIADFLKTNNISMRIHYIFPEYIDKQTVPDWMYKFSNDELRTWMQLHTKAILEKYPTTEIVVVNEALWMDNKGWAGFPDNNYLFERLGTDYVKMAFDFAHSIQPNATLIINQDTQGNGKQTNIVDSDVMKYLFNFVQQQVAQGVPIGGVGLEGHYLARDFVSQNTDQSIAKFKQELINLMKQYKTINVPAYITELDVNMGGLPSDWTQVQKEGLKAKIYSAVYEAAIESENCRSVTTWGFTNTSSWMIQGQYPYPPADSPLPYDDYYKPTISYYAILQSLLEAQLKQ